MGLLDGDLQGIFGGVFAPFFLDATLHTGRTQAFEHGRPAGAASWVDTPCKGMVDAYSEGYRTRFQIPATDAKLIVLQAGVPVTPSLDAEITIRGERYKILDVRQDPAQASWEIRGRPVGQA